MRIYYRVIYECIDDMNFPNFYYRFNTIMMRSWMRYFIYAITVGLFFALCVQCDRVKNVQMDAAHNMKALTDSISHYKTINGDIVSQKAILVGECDMLRQINDSLCDAITRMGVKNPDQIVYVETEIVHEKKDTIYIIDQTNRVFDFDFSDEYRILNGNVTVKDTTLHLSIDQDQVNVDWSVVIDNGVVYVSSSNPYVVTKDIIGVTIPTNKKTKKTNWIGVGPYIGVGIDPKMNVYPQIGVGIVLNCF